MTIIQSLEINHFFLMQICENISIVMKVLATYAKEAVCVDSISNILTA